MELVQAALCLDETIEVASAHQVREPVAHTHQRASQQTDEQQHRLQHPVARSADGASDCPGHVVQPPQAKSAD